MANRYFYKYQSIQKEIKALHMEIDIAGSGAPTLNSLSNSGIASITRTGTGVYDVVMSDIYTRFVGWSYNLEASSSEDLTFQITAQDPSASGGATFTFETLAAATPTDPSSGATLYITITARNSSVFP